MTPTNSVGGDYDRFGDKLLYIQVTDSAEEQAQTDEEQGGAAAPLEQVSIQAAWNWTYTYVFAVGFLKSDTGQYVTIRAGATALSCATPITVREYWNWLQPWHIRYVGVPHAEIIYRNRMTLESYVQSLEPGVLYSYEGYCITRAAGDDIAAPDGFISAVLSSDNTGGYIAAYFMG